MVSKRQVARPPRVKNNDAAPPTRASAPEIGRRIYAIRKARRLTLCDIEKKSGLSISVLSEIERGKVNPTFNTLWQLTQSLKIDIADLIERSAAGAIRSEEIEVVGKDATPTTGRSDGSLTVRVHTSQRQELPVEWYELSLKPGAEVTAEARVDRAWQHITVVRGQVEIVLGGKSRIIKAGDTARFSTKLGHVLRCNGSAGCLMNVVVISSFDLIGTGYSHYT